MSGLFSWLVIVGAMIWSFGGEGGSRRSDCIIVLGAAVRGDKPSLVFEERIKHAIDLFHRGEAPVIVFTGGYGDRMTHAESEVARSYAVSKGVSKMAILVETQSRTTQQNLAEAKKLMDSAGLLSAIIVSDPLHLKRASMMAKDLGISAVTSPTPTSRYRSLKTKLGFLFREVYFYHHYLVTGR